jgi:hypothetical protein
MKKHVCAGLATFLIAVVAASGFAQSATIATYVGPRLPISGTLAYLRLSTFREL